MRSRDQNIERKTELRMAFKYFLANPQKPVMPINALLGLAENLGCNSVAPVELLSLIRLASAVSKEDPEVRKLLEYMISGVV